MWEKKTERDKEMMTKKRRQSETARLREEEEEGGRVCQGRWKNRAFKSASESEGEVDYG